MVSMGIKIGAVGLLLVSLILGGCTSSARQSGENPPEQVQEKGSQSSAVTTVDTVGPRAPAWRVQLEGSLTKLLLPEGLPEVGVIAVTNGSLVTLGWQGDLVGSPLKIKGVVGSLFPDPLRLVVHDGDTSGVISLDGTVHWQGKTREGKLVELVTPVPGGRYIALSAVNEAWEGFHTRLIDLSGKELWRLEGASAGDVLRATATSLVVGNRQSVFRVSVESGRREELVRLDPWEEVIVSPQGTVLAVMGRTGGTLYDQDGTGLGSLPPGTAVEFSHDGERLLMRRGRNSYSYSLHAKNGAEMWKIDLDRSAASVSLSPDGRHVLVVRKDAGKENLLIDSYGATGALVWSSVVAIPPGDRNETVWSAFDHQGKVYVALGSSIWSWPVTTKE